MRFGVFETALRILRRCGALQAVYSLEFFLYHNTEATPRDRIEIDGETFSFWEVTPEILTTGGYGTAEGLPSVAEIAAMYAGGSKAFAAIVAGDVVALVWMNSSVASLVYIDKPEVLLPGGFVYCHSVVVSPRFRGHGIATELKRFAVSKTTDPECQRVVSAVYLENDVGQHWHRAVLREYYCGRITLVRLNNRRHWFLSNACRRDDCRIFLDAVIANTVSKP